MIQETDDPMRTTPSNGLADRISHNPDRRTFLWRSLTTGALACFGCPLLKAADPANEKPAAATATHKFQAKSYVSYADVFKFIYTESFIPLMKQLGEVLGREKFVALLRECEDKATAQTTEAWARTVPQRDLKTLTEQYRDLDGLVGRCLVSQVVEDVPTAFEIKVTECLWAKVFREAEAADIGHACCCYPDFAQVRAFNPRIKLTLTQTLMQGHPCCKIRYEMEA